MDRERRLTMTVLRILENLRMENRKDKEHLFGQTEINMKVNGNKVHITARVEKHLSMEHIMMVIGWMGNQMDLEHVSILTKRNTLVLGVMAILMELAKRLLWMDLCMMVNGWKERHKEKEQNIYLMDQL